MRYEAAVIAGDFGFVFADADAGRLVGNHPGADDREIAGEIRQRRVALVDVAFAAVTAIGFDAVAAAANLDIGAFAGIQRFAHIVAEQRLVSKAGRQQVRVAFEQIP